MNISFPAHTYSYRCTYTHRNRHSHILLAHSNTLLERNMKIKKLNRNKDIPKHTFIRTYLLSRIYAQINTDIEAYLDIQTHTHTQIQTHTTTTVKNTNTQAQKHTYRLLNTYMYNKKQICTYIYRHTLTHTHIHIHWKEDKGKDKKTSTQR